MIQLTGRTPVLPLPSVKKIERDFVKKEEIIPPAPFSKGGNICKYRHPPFNSLPSREGKRPGSRIKSGMTVGGTDDSLIGGPV